jgi:hypothetical protein
VHRGVALRLLKIGGEADPAALKDGRVHELSDRRENGGDGLIMGGELFVEPGFDLIETPGEIFVRGEQFAQLYESAHDVDPWRLRGRSSVR